MRKLWPPKVGRSRNQVETHEIQEKPRFQNFQSISILRENLWKQENLMITRLDANLIMLNNYYTTMVNFC
jgi:hypothetical protein